MLTHTTLVLARNKDFLALFMFMTTKAPNSQIVHALQMKIDSLTRLVDLLKKQKSFSEKLQLLKKDKEISSRISQDRNLEKLLNTCSIDEQFFVISLYAIGQGPHIFHKWQDQSKDDLRHFFKLLKEIEIQYDTIGGILGYYLTVIKLIVGKQAKESSPQKNVKYEHPPGIDLTKDTAELRQAIRYGIENMSYFAEIYPVGGAGDRLDLHDEITGEALPAAELKFCGKTLLEDLVRDLQSREYLHYKLVGKQVNTPIAMMTSHEKDNHSHILKICSECQWFGRPKDSFHLFTQPLVPVITIQGDWAMQGPLHPMLKPGGHGVIWKLARDCGVLDRFLKSGHRYALVRQINNPVAGTDHGLSAFLGWGSKNKKVFGFASCPRFLNASEGMNVLVEKQENEDCSYCITNVEYTEFEQYGIPDHPASAGSPYSTFPANTNILFVDLETVSKLAQDCPIPGMLINMKHQAFVYDSSEKQVEVPVGRLESTMQNIADYIVDHYPKKLSPPTSRELSSYVTYNERRKTISVTKKSYKPGESALETPEGCLFELLLNHYELLTKYCKMHVSPMNSLEDYLKKGPAFLVQLHPALGPLYPIIAQKIQKGRMGHGAEMQLEISELEMVDVDIEGSLLIKCENILGHRNKDGTIQYSEKTGKCTLRRVKVRNVGMQKEQSSPLWKNKIVRKEALDIVLEGNGEFFAEDVIFNGDEKIHVRNGERIVAKMRGEKIEYHVEKIKTPTWCWRYQFDRDDRIILSRR